MDDDKDKSPKPADEPTKATPVSTDDQSEQAAPADALSRTDDDLAEEEAKQVAESVDFKAIDKDERKRKLSRVKQFFRRINLYFLIFILLVIIVAAVAVVTYINNETAEPEIQLSTQELTEDTLQQLASRDATVGSSSQTLNIQGNTVIAGQTLMRGNLDVAGNIQSGGSLQGSSLTISGASNLGELQANGLQVASNLAVEGDTTLRGLNVAGSASFGGNLTASQITASRLILSGNASLEIPNHIRFPGASPSRSISPAVLGSGGSASVDGSDTAGTVSINTGNGPSAGCMVRVNFNQNFSNQPHVVISPVGAAAGRTQYYVDRDAAGFSICTSSPAPANQAFAFDYFISN